MNLNRARVPCDVLVIMLVAMVVGCSSNGADDESATPEPATPTVEATAAGEDAPPECATDGDCAEGQYCARPAGECGGDVGQCADKPAICTQDWNPVCGCDGKTYGNPCGAASAGKNIDHDGECRGSAAAN